MTDPTANQSDMVPGKDPSDTRSPSAWSRVLSGQLVWIALILMAMIATFSVLAGNAFASVPNARNIATEACILMVVAIGQLFVIVAGGIDLSVGAVLVFSGVVACIVMNALGGGPLAIVAGAIAGICCGCFWGVLNGLLVTKARISPLIATLGTFGMAMGLALVLSNGLDLSAPLPLVRSLGVGRVFGLVPWLVIIAAAVAVIMAIVLNQTRFGRHTFAIGASAAAAERSGVRIKLHLVKVYAIAGSLAGLASIMSLARFGTTTIGGHLEDNLKVITAVVLGGASLLGGIGTVTGTVIGTLIPVILLNGFVITGVQAFWQQFAIGVVLLIAVYLDTQRRSSSN